MSERKLEQDERQERIQGQVMQVYEDNKYGSGTLVRTLCGDFTGQPEKEKEWLKFLEKPMHRRLFVKINRPGEDSNKPGQKLFEEVSEHVVFEDITSSASQRCDKGSYSLMNINYGKVTEDLITRDDKKTNLDGELFIVKISKKFFE